MDVLLAYVPHVPLLSMGAKRGHQLTGTDVTDGSHHVGDGN